ncbi:MAG: 4Fe-4S dicluster domain-containing protein [Candidatus Lokiarchaeota archaeon]|nr:4Fe-4S dicluster domain-containing protein [Candidatus Lokiarchaeota archaeon]
MIKKSKGLKTKFIDNTKFKISAFKDDLAKRSMKIIPKMFKGIQKARRDYKEEIKDLPQELKTAPEEFWEEIVKEAKSLGIDLIGFAPIDENLIFEKDYTGSIELLYENGIVLGMEMDYDAISTAPNPPAGLESLRIYAELGEATNKLADFIRSKGYRVIACHPLGGPILYPAMAVKAKLGKIGSQGLLITKKFGPRQRLSLISINARPLPEINQEEFEISEFCKKCRRCINFCPVNAILDEPVVNENGTITRIDSEKCFEYFYETTGCSVCIEKCPFHKVGYKVLFYRRI